MSDHIPGFSPFPHDLPQTPYTRRAASVVSMAAALMGDERAVFNFHERVDRAGVSYNMRVVDVVTQQLLPFDMMDTLSDAAIVTVLMKGWARMDE